MSVWWRHNLGLERRSQANLCVCLRASEQINSSVRVIFYRKGGIRLRRRKTYYLNQMDHSVRPSWANVRLIQSDLVEDFLWEMHHKSTVLGILSELRRSDLINESDLGEVYCNYI